MPNYAKIAQEDVDAITDDGGLNKNTLKRKKQAMDHFKSYAESKEEPVDVDVLIERASEGDIEPLEKLIGEFFTAFRVHDDDTLPKRSTIEAYKSHIKMNIIEQTHGKVDISSATFKGLEIFFKGFSKKLKAAGKGELIIGYLNVNLSNFITF